MNEKLGPTGKPEIEATVYNENMPKWAYRDTSGKIKDKGFSSYLMELSDGGYKTTIRQKIGSFFKKIKAPNYQVNPYDGNDDRTPEDIEKAKLNYIHSKKQESADKGLGVTDVEAPATTAFASGLCAWNGYIVPAVIIGITGLAITLVGHGIVSAYKYFAKCEYNEGISKLTA